MPDEIKNKALTPIQQRTHDSMLDIYLNPGKGKEAMYQHSVLCQTYFPYRNQGDDVKMWQHKQGDIQLAITANPILNPYTREYEQIGIPYGSKPRLILAYLNTQAIKKQSSVLHVEESMTAFIKSLGLSNDGRTLKEVKEQLRRLMTANITLGYIQDNKVQQVDFKIVDAFEFWFPKDERQRVFWESKIQLSDKYFNSLQQHAIPLDERALSALAHNALALDIYSWLAQRLHRINPAKPQFVAWTNLKEQFGFGYSEIRKFRQIFNRTLKEVQKQYMEAKFEVDGSKGIYLYNSAPPIKKTMIVMPEKPFGLIV